MVLRNMALVIVALILRPQGASSAPNWPASSLPEPEMLAGVDSCRCVDIRQCPAVLEVFRYSSSSHGPDQTELNRLKRTTCGFRGFVPFVCCPASTTLESRMHLTPNTIADGKVDNIHHKKSYKPDYFTDEYPEHSSENHNSFVPSSSSDTDLFSVSDYPNRDQSKPLSHDDREDISDFGKSGSSYDDDEDEYSLEEDLEVPSTAHFANRPPHVHKHVPEFSESSEETLEHSHDRKKPSEQESKPTSENKEFPTRCRVGTTTVDVSVFSRSGLQKLQEFNPLCEGHAGSRGEVNNVTNSSEILLNIQKASSSPGVRLLPGVQCGVTVDERIVGGKEAELGAFPWIARIGYTRNGSSDGPFLYRCGGSLLNERYVLTAAHCVTNLPGGLELAAIRLGDHDERTNPDCKTPELSTCADPVQDFRPQSVTIHPRYDRPKYSNDLALIRLDRPARLSTYVSPICLPLGELGMKNYTGLKATVAGWGATHPGLTSSSPVLQWVRLGVVDAQQCSLAYEPVGVQVDFWRQLCAGGESMTDSCDGDSGGPLMRPEQPSPDSLPRYFLVGVVSFGAKICGTANMPGVYTRVAAYLGWILDSLQP